MKSLLCALVFIAVSSPCLADSPWAAGIASEALVSVDGSTITLSLMEGRMTVEFVSRGGDSETTTFSFVSDKMGTVSEEGGDGKPVGFFRQTDVGLEIQYDDGRSASLFANIADGLTMRRPGSGGDRSCVSWYPKDHVFSAEERREAVAAYAKSLGVNEAARAPQTKKRGHALHVEAASSVCSPAISAVKQSVDVPKVVAHPIEASAGPAVPAPPAPSGNTTAIAPKQAAEIVPTGAGASQCLAVEAVGGFVGFANRCGNDVQVAYCLQKGNDPTVVCGTGKKFGSVAAAGFTGVFADSGVTDRDVRWIGCSGAPGDVAPEFIHTDPPAGRCVKK